MKPHKLSPPKDPVDKTKRPIKTAVIVDPMGHGFGEFTAEDEIKDHVAIYSEELGRPLNIHTPNSPHSIEPGTELVLYDYGGMDLGNSLGDSNARAIIRWAEDNPNSLVIVVSYFTYRNYVKYELEDRNILALPNIICAFGDDETSEENPYGIPEWWKVGL